MDKEIINKITQIINFGIENNTDLDTILNNVFNILISVEGLSLGLRIEDVCEELETRRGCLEDGKTIILYRKGIDESVQEELTKYPFLSTKETEMFKIIYYTKSLIHELQHAKLKRAKEENSNDIGVSILKLCDKNPKVFNSIVYKLYYDAHPEERIVELYAFKSVTDISNNMGDEYQNLSKIIKKEYLLEKFYNYYKYGLDGPTSKYLKLFIDAKDFEEFTELLKEKNLSTEERMYYGFKISEQEYTTVVKEYIELDSELKLLTENVSKKNQ